MAATAYLWQTLRFDVFHVNPPLVRAVSGLPVAVCRPRYDWEHYSSRPQDRSEWRLGTAFVGANSPGMVRWCFALARWSLIPLLLVGGYFGYRLSREIFGNAAAVLFLALWCFSPSLLSWGATICPDSVAAALGVVAIYAFRRWLHGPTWISASMAGTCLGLLPLTKLTWIIAFGLWPLVWFIWTTPRWLCKAGEQSSQRPSLRQLVAILVIGLYVLNMGYLFDGTFHPLGEYEFVSQSLRGREVAANKSVCAVSGNRFASTWLRGIPVPLPGEFVQGIDTQRYDFERGLPSYLRGEWQDHGWWYYYFYALAIKVPLGTWCLAGLATGVTVVGRGYNAAWRDEMIVLLPGLAFFIIVSGQTGFSMHFRYVIPALPFFFVWIGKVARVFEMRRVTQRRLPIAVAVVVAITWSVGSSLWIYPHSLSYFNEVVGGPKNGGEHLLGSNIDWGQDLLYLKDWLDKHPEVTLKGLAFFGAYPAALAGIPETPYPPSSPLLDNDTVEWDIWAQGECVKWGQGIEPGWYVLSVNHLYDRSRRYRCFLDFEPVASAGYSIYIYHTPAVFHDSCSRNSLKQASSE